MPELSTNPVPSDPLALIRAACQKARAAGAVVSTCPDLGVVCTSTEAPTWETMSTTPVLSPLGAVLMVHQPRIPVADVALAHVLGVGAIWILGFEDAVTGGEPGASNVIRGPAVRLYGEGFRAGAEFRARFAVPGRRDNAFEVTEPIPGQAAAQRRGLLAQQLAAHTLADVVHALIAGIPGRDWSHDDKLDVLETLQEFALAYPGI